MVDARAVDTPTPADLERLEALHAELDKRISENADGSQIVHLWRPIQGGKLDRLTLRPIRVGDIRAVRDVPPTRRVEEYAARIVSPEGTLDELESDFDFTLVLRATGNALGKFIGGGPSSSQ